MTTVTWKNNLSINIHEIDEHNITLCTMMGKFASNVKISLPKMQINKFGDLLLNQLILSHNIEKQYFEKFGYDDSKNHDFEHDQLVVILREFLLSYDESHPLFNLAGIEKISAMFMNHIKNSDSEFGKFVKRDGIKQFFRKTS